MSLLEAIEWTIVALCLLAAAYVVIYAFAFSASIGWHNGKKASKQMLP